MSTETDRVLPFNLLKIIVWFMFNLWINLLFDLNLNEK